MKKSLMTILIGIAALTGLAGCGGTTSSVADSSSSAPVSSVAPEKTYADFAKYTAADWKAESFTGKTISHQFTGSWEMDTGDYGVFVYKFIVNLNSDGSVFVDNRNTKQHSSYEQFGYWQDKSTKEDGGEFDISVRFVNGLSAEQKPEIQTFKYDYEVFQQDDKSWTFTLSFGIAGAQYIRTLDVVCDNTVKYESIEAFHTAVDVAQEQTSTSGSAA